MIIERDIGGQIVRAHCAERNTQRANHVLDAFEEIDTLSAGTQMRFGWAFFRLLKDGDGLVVSEPLYANWPREQWCRTIDHSLDIVASQVSLAKRIHADTADTHFDQVLLCVPGALAEPRIFMRRDPAISEVDSGWLVGNVEDPEALDREQDLESVVLASLVQRRPALLQVLALPHGFIVTFSGDAIEQIYDADGRDRWHD